MRVVKNITCIYNEADSTVFTDITITFEGPSVVARGGTIDLRPQYVPLIHAGSKERASEDRCDVMQCKRRSMLFSLEEQLLEEANPPLQDVASVED